MANIIIPVEHQSAPKEPARIVAPFNPEPKKSGPAPWDSYDREMSGVCSQADKSDIELVKKMRRESMLQERLDGVEESLRQFETTSADARLKAARWDGQERWQGKENEEMRMVRILHCNTFIDKLKRAGIPALIEDPIEWYRDNTGCSACGSLQRHHVGPTLRCGESLNTNWAPDLSLWPRPHARLWLNSFSRQGRVGISAIVNGVVQSVTSLQYPFGPEYSIMRFDEYNVPTTEKYRGWRTALLKLIIANVLTEEEADKAFGPALGPAGAFYREQLFKHRSIRYGVTQ